MKRRYLPCLILLLAVFFTGVRIYATPSSENDDADSAETNRIYRMPRSNTPLRLSPYTMTTYSADRFKVNTFRGDELYDAGKDTISVFAVNPAGHNFIIIKKNKKGRKAEIYSTGSNEERTAKFDSKKYGMPVTSVFAPDARTLYVATDSAIYLCDPRTMLPFNTLSDKGFVPELMTVSPNGFFLAAVRGDKCRIFNLENNTVRKDINAGELITDAAFSPDNSEFALLTDDGVLTLYGTRTFDMRKMVSDLGAGTAFAYNFDGKYVAVVISPEEIELVNLLKDTDRESFSITGGGLNDVNFVTDALFNTVMVNTALNAVEARRLMNLKPYYNKLINDEVEARMSDWLKMMPGETMEEYKVRISGEARSEQQRMFEYEISTRMAGDLLAGSNITLGTYDRANGVLAIDIEKMPTIFLPVPESEVTAFRSGADVELSDVLFGVNPDDSFEIVFAKVLNRNNGKSYVFDNRNRVAMDYMHGDDAISLETLQQQQMEEIKLQELREKVMQEAKSTNVISDHTNITVNSRLVPAYDADGNSILNYVVDFTYDVSPGFSVQEDFGPGKYHVEESGAASSMLKIIKEAFEGDFAQYLQKSKKLRINLTGTADATPIVNGIKYDGSFGNYEDEPVLINGQLSAVSVNPKNLIKENPELAFLRALGVKDFLEKNVENYDSISKDYTYEVNVSQDKGSEYRRITVSFTFVDAF